MIQYGMVALLGLLFSKSIHVFNGYTGTENVHVHDGIYSDSQWQPPIVFGSRGGSLAVESHSCYVRASYELFAVCLGG